MADPIEICRYQYDPLDRLATRTPLSEAIARRFYNGDSLATELQGTEQHTVVRAGSRLLAHKSQSGIALLGTDQQNSVLHAEDIAIAYAPYGHRETIDVRPGLPGFNGEQPDPVTGHYLLGNGYRAYNPVLMRFNSPDSLSPFGTGGLNAYAYCLGDPINRGDPSGHVSWQFLVGMTLSLVSLTLATVTLFPSLPFLVSVGAAKAGFVSAGSASTIATGVAGVAGGVVSVARQVVGELDPDSPALEPLGWTAMALGLTAVSSRVGTVIAARNPKNLTDLKRAIEVRGERLAGKEGFDKKTVDYFAKRYGEQLRSSLIKRDRLQLGLPSPDPAASVRGLASFFNSRFRHLRSADKTKAIHNEFLSFQQR
ncbi:RHS repeat-associated core domain-containing protein [Pseudomonas syringae]|uniref:RHS repeat-associated core domain-containing protein n=1 Tax=Pseudomonas syringae TaxID=317 RepID=UPI00068D1D25|nr:RHS repeat-associated core domain-containing protein [Pseudomonas syringae]